MIDDSELIAELLAAGLANQRLVQQAIELSEEAGESLYRVFIFENLVEERDVVEIASELLNVPFVDLSTAEIDEEVLGLLPKELAQESRSLPLEFFDDGGGRTLRLAMIDPIDVMAMDDVANHTGVNIRPVLVGPADFEKALARVYERSSPFGLPELPSLSDRDPEDSWAALFDEPAGSESLDEESAVLSQEMRDRPPTDIFEVVEDDFLEDDPFGLSSLSGLVAPADDEGVLASINLDDWELDDALGSSPRSTPERASPAPHRNDQTLIGVGIRGILPELDHQEAPFEGSIDAGFDAEEEEEDFDGGLMGFELPGGAPEDEEDVMTSVQELSEPSLEHSIELALDLGDFEELSEPPLLSPLDDQATIAVPFDAHEFAAADFITANKQREQTAPRMRFDDYKDERFGEAPEGAGFELEEISEPVPEQRAPSAPKSIRAALQRAAARKGREREPNDESKLGRIKVKRVAVPKFQGAVEKRSDKERERAAREPTRALAEPATRELSVEDLMGLAAGAQEETPGSAKETAEAIPISATGTDLEVLLQGLLRILVAKEILSHVELERLLAEAIREGEG